MLKYIALIITALALQGCMWQTVDSYDISRAVKFCGGVENVAKIKAAFAGDERVFCYDNTSSSLDHVRGVAK